MVGQSGANKENIPGGFRRKTRRSLLQEPERDNIESNTNMQRDNDNIITLILKIVIVGVLQIRMTNLAMMLVLEILMLQEQQTRQMKEAQ